MDGYNTVGYTHWKLGRYAAALPYVAKVASAAYRVRRHGSLSIVFGEDPESPAATTRPSPASCGQTPPPPNGILRPEWRSPAPSSSPSRSPKCCGRIAWLRTNAAMPRCSNDGRSRSSAPARKAASTTGAGPAAPSPAGRAAARGDARRPRADGRGAAGVARHRHVRKHALHARPLRGDLHEARPAGARGRGPGGSVGARAQDRRMLVRGGTASAARRTGVAVGSRREGRQIRRHRPASVRRHASRGAKARACSSCARWSVSPTSARREASMRRPSASSRLCAQSSSAARGCPPRPRLRRSSRRSREVLASASRIGQ